MNAFIGGDAADSLAEGLYESLHTDSLAEYLQHAPDFQANFENVDAGVVVDVLARHIYQSTTTVSTSCVPILMPVLKSVSLCS